MKIHISEMAEKNISEVIKFHNKYLGGRDSINKEEISKRLKSNKGIFLVAKDERKLIGIKLGYIDNNICIGRGIAVDKEFRRLGIGKELIKTFEDRLKSFTNIKKYVFASSTQEGVPFHIEFGYRPLILLQSKDKNLLQSINLEKFTIKQNHYNKDYNVYQIYLESKKKLDLTYLSKIKSKYPQIDIQYLFEKNF